MSNGLRNSFHIHCKNSKACDISNQKNARADCIRTSWQQQLCVQTSWQQFCKTIAGTVCLRTIEC